MRLPPLLLCTVFATAAALEAIAKDGQKLHARKANARHLKKVDKESAELPLVELADDGRPKVYHHVKKQTATKAAHAARHEERQPPSLVEARQDKRRHNKVVATEQEAAHAARHEERQLPSLVEARQDKRRHNKVVATEQEATLRLVGPDGKTGSREILSQMQDLISTKGQVGLTDEEKAFVQEIQTLWKSDIMPAIEEAITEAQSEITALFQAILECEAHVADNHDYIVGIVQGVDQVKLDLANCVHQESSKLATKKKVCLEKREMKTVYVAPLTPPGAGATNAERLEYLQAMNEYFCGTDHDFETKITTCTEATSNHSAQEKTCIELQGQLEKFFCDWKSGASSLCQSYDTCRRDALAQYYKAKEKVEVIEEQQQKDYEAAVRIECLWDAWDLSDTPCLVDEEKVDACYEQPVDQTNYTITYPLVPDPHECSMDAQGQIMTHDEEDRPCTEKYVSLHYAALGAADEVTARMEASCSQCKEIPGDGDDSDEGVGVFVEADMKCPWDHGDRLYRLEQMTLETCYQKCVDTPGCLHYSFAVSGGYAAKGVCMGCVQGLWEKEQGFNAYDLPKETAVSNFVFVHTDDNKVCLPGPMKLFEHGHKTTSECYEECSNVEGCKYFSVNPKGTGIGKCVGCAGANFTKGNGYFTYSMTPLSEG